MKISILLPTLGERKKELDRLLKSLENQSYQDFEIIIVTQDNHTVVANQMKQFRKLAMQQVKLQTRGISAARNAGTKTARGEIIILSDDDCWYPEDALENIVQIFNQNKRAQVVLTQIYDKDRNTLYKRYPQKAGFIKKKLDLMSKSSIEIAYKVHEIKHKEFDEILGLGAMFVCGEEVDFLLRNFLKHRFLYVPKVTVYHPQKSAGSSEKQIIAKGALYGRNFNLFVCIAVLVRDFIVKRENNFKLFFEGYHDEFHKRYR